MAIKTKFLNNPSIHSLKGERPATREGALNTSQLHAQGVDPNRTMKANHSVHDLNGLTHGVNYTDTIKTAEAKS